MQSFEGHSHSLALHMALSASNALRVAYFGTDVQLYLQECHGYLHHHHRAHTHVHIRERPPLRFARIVPPSRFHSRRDADDADADVARKGQTAKSIASPSLFALLLLFLSTLSLFPSLLRRPDKTSHKSGVMRHQRRPSRKVEESGGTFVLSQQEKDL